MDPGSEIRDPEKTYSGSWIQGSKRQTKYEHSRKTGVSETNYHNGRDTYYTLTVKNLTSGCEHSFFPVPSVTMREKNKPEKKLARKKLSVCNSAFKELTFCTSEAFLLAEKFTGLVYMDSFQ